MNDDLIERFEEFSEGLIKIGFILPILIYLSKFGFVLNINGVFSSGFLLRLTPLALGIILYYFTEGIQENVRRRIESVEQMKKLHRRDFEHYIAFILQELGFETEVTKPTKDGGIDIIARYKGKIYYLQCKKRLKRDVQLKDIRDFYGAVMSYDKNAIGIFVTTTRLTNDAQQFAQENNIEIRDKYYLQKYLDGYYSDENSGETESKEPICNKCGGKMTLRTAQKGPNKGNKFYGCSNYPKCKNIINLPHNGL